MPVEQNHVRVYGYFSYRYTGTKFDARPYLSPFLKIPEPAAGAGGPAAGAGSRAAERDVGRACLRDVGPDVGRAHAGVPSVCLTNTHAALEAAKRARPGLRKYALHLFLL